MAGMWGARERCSFFMNGNCTAGNLCRFSHSVYDISRSQLRQRTCRFFAADKCFFGPRCRNVHASPATAALHTETDGGAAALATPHAGAGNPGAGPIGEFGSVGLSEAEGACGNDQPPENMNSDARDLAACTGRDGALCHLLSCSRSHGRLCEVCNNIIMHVTDAQLEVHVTTCRRNRRQHERRVEAAMGRVRSAGKSCGICLDPVMEKTPGEQRFGILPNCQHCYCLSCMRKWRQSRQFDPNVTRSCPQCRVPSDFVCPSAYWVETKEQKEKLITDYKAALGLKECKYFRSGRGSCPFGNQCFYRHAFPDGTLVDVGPPRQRRRDTARDVLEMVVILREADNPWEPHMVEVVSVQEYYEMLGIVANLRTLRDNGLDPFNIYNLNQQ